ncbi:DJ-1/PfpI family protein [Brevifollis gellanilyticus]|uniref:Glutamine amidotransferase n=1 Tax=Brevifollis gellanilyticus TaxID=748831 RepID=A0A512MCM9_9BACT|nr:DJ-1/PfpI family protein [Brevifollis gellanilyticus]GEP44111.1 glutamine amidotransferase [Brevifollis gellanilyticus]
MSSQTISVAIFVFPEVEVLDFAGPYEVFTTASRAHLLDHPGSTAPFSVFSVAREPGTIRARAGLKVIPDHDFTSHPPVDLLIIPGGVVTAELQTPEVAEWIKRISLTTIITASVCTGAFLLAQAGLLDGKQATTHWEDIADLREMFPSVTVLEGRRWVDEGSIITSAGISAGIDMSLHIVERLAGRDLALKTAHRMDFDWHQDAASAHD